MTVPLVAGARSTELPELRQALPINLQIQLMDVGITKLYLAPIEGVELFAALPGTFRGYVVWQTKLVAVINDKVYVYDDITATFVEAGQIPDDGERVQFAQSFERLAILTGGAVYYLTEGATFEVIAPTDPSLRQGVKSIVWVGGYFILSDGVFLYNTNIANPDVVTPSDSLQIQTDSSEILGLLVLRSELYVVLRNSIQMLQNTGAQGFPFTVVQSAMIAKGALNPRAFVFFMDVIAFVGGAANEAPSVYIYVQGALQRVSTQEVDLRLSALSFEELSNLKLESCVFNAKANLYIHVGGDCYVYDHLGTQNAGLPLWHRRTDSLNEIEKRDYSCNQFMRYNGVTLCIQSDKIMRLVLKPYTVDGKRPYWTFSTPIVYNEARGFIIHKEELMVLPGRDDAVSEGFIGVSSSQDGINWSPIQTIKTGRVGETLKNIVWLRRGFVRNWRIEKFVGVNAPYMSFLLLECDVEDLQV